MSADNHYVTPTYQALLILCMDTVSKRLMDSDVFGAWQALKTLYVELPPVCQKDCEKNYQAVVDELSKIYSYEYTTYREKELQTKAHSYRYLTKANFTLFNKFKESLFANGYLEIAPIKPRNPQPTALGEQPN
jgi:hypothetical protein